MVAVLKSPCCWQQHVYCDFRQAVQGKTFPWCYQKQLPKAWAGTKSVDRWADDSCQNQTSWDTTVLAQKVSQIGPQKLRQSWWVGYQLQLFHLFWCQYTRGCTMQLWRHSLASNRISVHQNFRLVLDNWFWTISLMQKLNKEGILATAIF